MMNWVVFRRKRSWPDRRIIQLFRGGTEGNHKNFNRDNRSVGQNRPLSNQGSRALQIRQPAPHIKEIKFNY